MHDGEGVGRAPALPPMTTSRLTRALQAGEFDMLQGGLAVFNAPGDLSFDQIDAATVTASQTFYPDHAMLAARGINVTPVVEAACDNALVLCHRAKAATFDLIAQAASLTRAGGLVCIDGAKTDGIESILKELRGVIPDMQVYSKSHGKLIWFTRPESLPDIEAWRDVTYLFPNGWTTHAASFSSDGPDAGSKLLAGAVPPLKGRVADLGSGWGYLSGEALKSEGVTELHGFEADYHAVQCAKNNVQDPRAQFEWCDVSAQTGAGFDVVITNPPFHVSRKPDPALGASFIRKAADMLKPKGSLWMVANRNLPYEAVLEERFHKVQTATQTGGFKVIHAAIPKKTRA